MFDDCLVGGQANNSLNGGIPNDANPANSDRDMVTAIVGSHAAHASLVDIRGCRCNLEGVNSHISAGDRCSRVRYHDRNLFFRNSGFGYCFENLAENRILTGRRNRGG